jgi:hypothetical protein
MTAWCFFSGNPRMQPTPHTHPTSPHTRNRRWAPLSDIVPAIRYQSISLKFPSDKFLVTPERIIIIAHEMPSVRIQGT